MLRAHRGSKRRCQERRYITTHCPGNSGARAAFQRQLVLTESAGLGMISCVRFE